MAFCVVKTLKNQLLICLSIDRHEKENTKREEQVKIIISYLLAYSLCIQSDNGEGNEAAGEDSFFGMIK